MAVEWERKIFGPMGGAHGYFLLENLYRPPVLPTVAFGAENIEHSGIFESFGFHHPQHSSTDEPLLGDPYFKYKEKDDFSLAVPREVYAMALRAGIPRPLSLFAWGIVDAAAGDRKSLLLGSGPIHLIERVINGYTQSPKKAREAYPGNLPLWMRTIWRKFLEAGTHLPGTEEAVSIVLDMVTKGGADLDVKTPGLEIDRAHQGVLDFLNKHYDKAETHLLQRGTQIIFSYPKDQSLHEPGVLLRGERYSVWAEVEGLDPIATLYCGEIPVAEHLSIVAVTLGWGRKGQILFPTFSTHITSVSEQPEELDYRNHPHNGSWQKIICIYRPDDQTVRIPATSIATYNRPPYFDGDVRLTPNFAVQAVIRELRKWQVRSSSQVPTKTKFKVSLNDEKVQHVNNFDKFFPPAFIETIKQMVEYIHKNPKRLTEQLKVEMTAEFAACALARPISTASLLKETKLYTLLHGFESFEKVDLDKFIDELRTLICVDVEIVAPPSEVSFADAEAYYIWCIEEIDAPGRYHFNPHKPRRDGMTLWVQALEAVRREKKQPVLDGYSLASRFLEYFRINE